MRGVKRCQESTGRMKKSRDSHEFKVTAVKMAHAPNIETKAVAEALHLHPFMLSRWKKEVREGTLKGLAYSDLQEQKAVEVAVAEEKRIRQLEAALKANIRFYNHLHPLRTVNVAPSGTSREMSTRAVSVEHLLRLTCHGEVSPNAIPKRGAGSMRAIFLACG